MNAFTPDPQPEIAAELKVDAADLEVLKALLDFTDADERLLRLLHESIGGLRRDFIDDFYVALAEVGGGATLFADPDALEALKDRQLLSFSRLTAGDYGLGYVRDRMRIGTLRYHHGLKPEWYRGLYTRYIAALAPKLWECAAGDPTMFGALFLALNKVVLLDLSLTVDAYSHADNEMLRLLAKVFESEFEGIVIADADRRIVHSNGMASRLLQRPPSALAVDTLDSVVADRAAFAAAWQEVSAAGAWCGELVVRSEDGHGFPAAVSIGCTRDDFGRATHYVMEFSDITERVEAQAALLARTEDLGRSNRDLEQFAYVASHDLQEPLRMVASYTQLLARRCKGRLDAEEEEFIQYAVDGARRMQTLINDLLAFSRIGTHGKTLAATSSLAALQRAIANLHLAIEQNGAVITHGELPAVVADPVQLAQLLQNLLGNAIKYRGAAPPAIHVAAVRDGRSWVFSVRDNGIGIAPEYFERIFEVFQRLHTKSEYPGTGIGLAIAKKIVERHGGRIWLESEPGKGTIFFFSLPHVDGKGELQ